MLEMAMMEMAMEKATTNDPLSNHATALLRRWIQSLKKSSYQMMIMMMMMNKRKRKVPLTVPMLL
jgi:hypothetical protein